MLTYLTLFALTSTLVTSNHLGHPKNITLEFASQRFNYSLINSSNPAFPPENRGVECGSVIKVNNTYHLFVTELLSPPCPGSNLYWCHTNLAHWVSQDKYNWTRSETVAHGHGRCGTKDNRAVYWSPMVHFRDDYWWLTFVGYDFPCNNYAQNGVIFLLKSSQKGIDGIGASYVDLNTQIMNATGRQPWEGAKDVIDSFSGVYFVTNATTNQTEMWAYYGSCCTSPHGQTIGLAKSADVNSMFGPWERYQYNPLNFTGGSENPIVTKTSQGYYLVVLSATGRELKGIGFSWSLDGIHWSDIQIIDAAQPIPYARLPLGLIEEDDGSFTLFYTDFDARHAGSKGVWNGKEGMYVSKLRLVVS